MRSRKKNAASYWVLFAGILFLLESSCAIMRPIPKAEYRAADPTGNKTYRLTTNDERVYEFKRFAVTDSTLVILEGKTREIDDPSREMNRIKAPVVVPWDEVGILERFERSNTWTVIGILVGAAAVYGIVYMVTMIYYEPITGGLP
jgi:hypothetical protein